MMIKNLQISVRKKVAYGWFTLTPETSVVTPRTMSRLEKIIEIVQEHAEEYWDYDEEDSLDICMTKCDIAVDLRGAFLPIN